MMMPNARSSIPKPSTSSSNNPPPPPPVCVCDCVSDCVCDCVSACVCDCVSACACDCPACNLRPYVCTAVTIADFRAVRNARCTMYSVSGV